MSVIQRRKITLFDSVNYSAITLISLVCLFPFFYVVSVSLTDPSVYVPNRFYLIPDQFSLASYKHVLSTNSFITALKNTIFITVVGTILNLCFTFPMAYALTKKTLPHRKLLMFLILFTLVFNPGIIPNYLLVKELGLINSYWSLLLPVLTNAWSLIVVKSFMDSLPPELEQAAKIDGCSDIGVFFRIILPLSTACIATFTLFFAVAHWNTYFTALIYISDSDKRTLQVLLKSLVLDANTEGVGTSDSDIIMPKETIRLASIVLAMLPILMIYPFLQKYFAKGVMLGSVKG